MPKTVSDIREDKAIKRNGTENEKVKKDKKTHALALQSLAACAIIDRSFLWMR